MARYGGLETDRLGLDNGYTCPHQLAPTVTDTHGAPVSRQIPWLRVFVEGVVIVASILLAFAISEHSGGTFYRARKALHDKGYVFVDKVGRGAYYSLTDKGEEALATNPPLAANSGGGSNPNNYRHAGASLEAPQPAVRAEVGEGELPWDAKDLLYAETEREALHPEATRERSSQPPGVRL
jgi:DNA-binding PadR family transcriptional regulator